MNSKTLSALILLNDLQHAAMDSLRGKHKFPSLLLFYSFIDICASLAEEVPVKTIRARFESYLRKYALSNWSAFSPHDLWAARSSLLHTYSPLGNHTGKPNGAKTIFYYAYPETKEEMHSAILAQGYSDFYLMDVNTIKHVAVSSFNGLWMRVESDVEFELKFRQNATHLLRNLHHLQLENELATIENFQKYRIEKIDD